MLRTTPTNGSVVINHGLGKVGTPSLVDKSYLITQSNTHLLIILITLVINDIEEP